MHGIVVGVDGSETAGRALRWALGEAALRGKPLTVVTVHPAPVVSMRVGAGPVYFGEATEELAAARRVAVEQVEHARAELGTPESIEVTVEAEAGTPTDVLLRYAAEAEHLVVGSRGIGGFKRLLLGSVSTGVVHHARCPVTVVPGDRPAHHE